MIVNQSSWFKTHFTLFKKRGGCAKQFQILGTDPVEGVDDDCTRVEGSYFGHCNNKRVGSVETPPEAWGGGLVIKDERTEIVKKVFNKI